MLNEERTYHKMMGGLFLFKVFNDFRIRQNGKWLKHIQEQPRGYVPNAAKFDNVN